MKTDLVLAGVGGQGILTIAKVVCEAALTRGLHFKQAEVHGMSQRGGSVQTHLRLDADQVLSDLVAVGQADLLVAVEPLEALRYAHFLHPDGALISSVNPFINITNYPEIDEILRRVASYDRHVLIDAVRMAKAAGTKKAANVVMLGATSVYLDLGADEVEAAIESTFARGGERMARINKKAFALGRAAAQAYLAGLEAGGDSKAILAWIEGLDPEILIGDAPPTFEA
jgi:indolepyruvate ferredoxin oxidoreductase, beta subunit